MGFLTTLHSQRTAVHSVLLSSDETVFGNKYVILQKNTVFGSKIFIYY